MQRRSIKQVEAVTGCTPQELANNYNEAMRRLQGCHPTDEWHGDVVYIYYFCDETVAECLTDEHELIGDLHKCGECPHCTKQLNRHGEVDVRFKWAVCGKTGEPVRVDENACDIYYSMQKVREEEGRQEGMNKDVKIKMIQFDVNQIALAKQLGVSQARISQILNREMSPELHEKVMTAIEECALRIMDRANEEAAREGDQA